VKEVFFIPKPIYIYTQARNQTRGDPSGVKWNYRGLTSLYKFTTPCYIRLQAHVIQCWRRDALSGVVQRWPWTVSTDAVQLVNYSKSPDRKQRNSCMRPMAVAVRCTSSFPEGADRRCRRPVRWTTGRQSSARYGGARTRRHFLTSIAILYVSARRLKVSVVLEE